MNERFRVMQRQPRRISITLSYHVHEALLSRSEDEGIRRASSTPPPMVIPASLRLRCGRCAAAIPSEC